MPKRTTKEEEETTSYFMCERSDEYLNACNILIGHKTSTNVIYYLFCHGVELSLKAFLRYNGWEMNIIINDIGHDMNKAITECRRIMIPGDNIFTDKDWRCLQRLNKYYKRKYYEYSKWGLMVLPKTIDETLMRFIQFNEMHVKRYHNNVIREIRSFHAKYKV